MGQRRDAYAVMLVGLVYLGVRAGVREINLLESQDLGIARALFSTYALSPEHSPLHFAFLNVWESLSSTSVAFLRWPSVFFAALAGAVVTRTTRALAGRRAGVLAGLVFVTNPQVVDEACSLRLYALNLLLAALTIHYALRYRATRRRSAAIGFLVCAVLAVYNHLFAWLLVGGLGGLLVLEEWRTHARFPARRALVVATLCFVPQLVHIVVALTYTQERHALHQGMSRNVLAFFATAFRALFVGDQAPSTPLFGALSLFAVAAALVGLVTLKRTGVWLAAVIVPALGAGWILSFKNPVEPRYLGFVLPATAIAIGAAAPRRRHLRTALGVATLAVSIFATREAFLVQEPDWRAFVEDAMARRKPDDVVAVFPDFWGATFERYGGPKEHADVLFPSELDRVVARGKRVLLVAYPGREMASLEAYLSQRVKAERLVDREAKVFAIAPVPKAAAPTSGSILLGGLVGSGGYEWQDDESVPFERLAAPNEPFVIGYQPYHPSLVSRALLLGAASRLPPNARVEAALADAGVTHRALVCSSCEPGASGPPLIERGARVVRSGDIGLLSLSGVDEGAVRAARAEVAHLVVLVPSAPDYGRTATAEERRVAHAAIDAGADAVVGLGGFAAKEIERYRGRVIAYSLGTLLRPRLLTLNEREASGVLMRLRFGVEPTFEVVPVTFDDRSHVGRGALRPADVSHLVDPPLEATRAGTEGPARDLGPLRPAGSLRADSAVEQWWFTQTREVSSWFPLTANNTYLRPYESAFLGGGAVVAHRGALGLGVYRRVVELDPGPNASVWAAFDDVVASDALVVAYGLADDRLRSKMVPLHEQRLSVELDGERVASFPIPYRTGWTESRVDVGSRRARPTSVRLVVDSADTHFPVAVAVSGLTRRTP